MNKQEKIRFTEETTVRALSPATVRAYEGSLKQFFDFYKGKAAKSLGLPEIKAYQRHLIEKATHSPNTINRHLTAIRVFYRWVYGRLDYTAANLPRMLIFGQELLEQSKQRRVQLRRRKYWEFLCLLVWGIRESQNRCELSTMFLNN